MFRSVFDVKNAWLVRIVALGCMVLTIGIGSQVLVSALADTVPAGTTMLKVTAYTLNGWMTDGNWSHPGACAVALDQFSYGTVIALYNTDGSFNQKCTAEDSNEDITDGQISLLIPGNAATVSHWGTQYLMARVLRTGWGKGGMPVQFTPVSLPALPAPHSPARLKR